MVALLSLLLNLLFLPFKGTSQLEAKNAALRHQLVVLQRKVRGRIALTNGDRLFFILLYRLFPSIRKAMTFVRPETVVRWHRVGFRHYWRWESWRRIGRPSQHIFRRGHNNLVHLDRHTPQTCLQEKPPS